MIFNLGNIGLICLKMSVVAVWISVCVHIEGIAFMLFYSWIKVDFKMGFVLVVTFN